MCSLGDWALTWDEFSPSLYRLIISLKAAADGRNFLDDEEVTFGLREFKSENGAFRINGRVVFLRGTHDGCVFPLTGYPPMDVAGWRRVFHIAKSYGLNSFRFHTWCPPEAAFEAADEAGIYLQPELPNWAVFGQPEHDEFLKAEGERILRQFGNHPSFISLALGNELGGSQELMAPVVAHFKSLDPRHLYAQGSNNWFPKPPPGDDYWTSFQADGKHIRGSYSCVDRPLGHIQTGPASTEKDYSQEIAGWPVPIISFEVGQYQVSPDLREIEKYTGVVRARNFEIYRDRLKTKGMLDQADDFVRASGALSALCYREEFEAALRTRGFDGISILDLKDFPGQGTALVGILNAFMESKGLIEPAEWRQFCSETVMLVRMPKYTWTQGETFTAKAEVAHYGLADLLQVTAAWSLRDAEGQTLKSGRLPGRDLPQGDVTSLGSIEIALGSAPAPARLELELALEGTPYRNVYPVWVFPDQVDTSPSKVLISRALDEPTRRSLEAGATVLLLPELKSLTRGLEGMWSSDFWNYGMFNRMAVERKAPPVPGTVGILCDPNHPALRGFPTEFHSDWQWFDLIRSSRAVILDDMPVGYRPLLQVIDTFERCHKLGTIFEVAVGRGKLLVCAIDLPALRDKPEARQLLHTLVAYMNSDAFAPAASVDWSKLKAILQ